MLRKKCKINSGFKFIRKTRNYKSSYCCLDSSLCQYYYINYYNDSVYKNKLKCILENIKIQNTDLYHLCSYMNYEKSEYIYAPEKTI